MLENVVETIDHLTSNLADNTELFEMSKADGDTAGLQAIGIDSATAMSTAIAFRLVTFYLPPIWGSYGMRWLRKRQYV